MTKLSDFTIALGQAIIAMDDVAVMSHPGTSLIDSQFLTVGFDDGTNIVIHLQEKTDDD